MNHTLRTSVALGCGLVLAAGATAATATAAPRSKVALRSFASCAGFLDYVREQARAIVGPYGLSQYGSAGVVAVPTAPPVDDTREGGPTAPAEPAPAPEPAPPATGGGDDGFSTTNVQEAGVDEPDLVKTDGARIYALANGRLWIVQAAGAGSRVLGSLELPEALSGGQLLLDGSRVLVLASGLEPLRALPELGPGDVYPILQPTTALVSVDVSQPAAPAVLERLTVEGSLVSARQVGGTVRIVLTSVPGDLVFTSPASGEPAAMGAATVANRRILSASRVRSWTPLARLENVAAGTSRTRRLVACDEIERPRAFGGLGMVSVLTIDLEHGLRPVDSDAVLTDGQLVYASPTGLYVATQRWADSAQPGLEALPGRTTTAIHKFDTSRPGETAYRASGSVPGYLLNQFSLSEYEGLLRVASTDEPAWWSGETLEESESFVTVLGEDGGRLARLGQVGGLGKGERIYAVRFLGTLGYVVTFRQTDPLYVVDLADPRAPKVAGELKILGYSAYLHPLGDGLLLGVGQDATEEGRTLGTQLSLFDVSNPAAPTRLQQATIENGFSEAEWDHHAFLFWPPTKLAVIPIQAYRVDPTTGRDTGLLGAVGFQVDRSAITRVGTVTHLPDVVGPIAPGSDFWFVDPYRAQISRAIVASGSLYTLSQAGVKASDLATFATQAFVPLAAPTPTTTPPA